MPEPVLLVACEGASEDRHAGVLSLFNILEKVMVREETLYPQKTEQGNNREIVLQSLRWTVVAIWMKEPADPDCEYESELAYVLPDGSSHSMAKQTFRFASESLFVRQMYSIMGIPEFLHQEQTAIVFFEHRIQATENAQRYVQRFPIVIEPVSSAPSNQPA